MHQSLLNQYHDIASLVSLVYLLKKLKLSLHSDTDNFMIWIILCKKFTTVQIQYGVGIVIYII